MDAVLHVYSVLDIERAGHFERTDAVLLEQFREVQRVVTHLKGCIQRGGACAKVTGLGIDGGALLTGEGGDIVIVIRHSRVDSGVGIFIISYIQRRRSGPMVGGPVYEFSQKPLFSR